MFFSCCCGALILKTMKQIKGTFNEIVDKVPTKAISMMLSQKRDDNYIFTVDVQNGYLLVW